LDQPGELGGGGLAEQLGVVRAAARPGEVRAFEVDAGQQAVVAELGQRRGGRGQPFGGVGDQAGHHRGGAVALVQGHGVARPLLLARREGSARPAVVVHVDEAGYDVPPAQAVAGTGGGFAADVRDLAVFDGQPSLVNSVGGHDAGVGESKAHGERITDLVRCRGSSGFSSRANALATEARWARTSSAIGSRPLSTNVPPAASTWRRRPSGAAPSIQVTRPGPAMLIGPCRYSIAG